MDVVDAEFLMEEFNLSEGDAISALNDLQKYRIIGRDMEDGEHDVLVHDMDELDNLRSHERHVTPQQNAEEPTGLQEPTADAETEQARQQELERQRKLNSTEGDAPLTKAKSHRATITSRLRRR